MKQLLLIICMSFLSLLAMGQAYPQMDLSMNPDTIKVSRGTSYFEIQYATSFPMPPETIREQLNLYWQIALNCNWLTVTHITTRDATHGSFLVKVLENTTNTTRENVLFSHLTREEIIIIQNLVNTYNVTGGGVVFPGKTVTVTLDGREPGVTYRLYRDNIRVAEQYETSEFTGLTRNGVYTIRAVYNGNEFMMRGSVEVWTEIIPYLLGGGGILKGDTPVDISLSMSQTGIPYRLLRDGVVVESWIGDGNFRILKVSQPGVYSIEAGIPGHTGVMRNSVTVTRSSEINYTRDYNFKAEKKYIQSTNENTEAKNTSDVIYFDGWGRQLQEIQVNGSPDGHSDLVTPHSNGIHNLVEREYLPYAKENNFGKYIENALSAPNWQIFGNEEKAHAFTLVEYDNSPLNRVMKKIGPGKAWQVNNKGMTSEYGVNEANKVRLYRVNTSGNLIYDGTYPTGTLLKISATDEDGNKTEVYKDRDQKTILTVQITGNERLETYNVYDDRGLLRYVLSPEASSQSGTTVNETLLLRHAYYYDYDVYSRMIIKRLPGCDPVYMVYDKRDRLVMSQDGNQRSGNTGKWSYSLYDPQNRVIETGEVALTAATTHAALQATASTSKNFSPAGTLAPLQYTLYDSYTPTPNVPVQPFVATAGYSTAYYPNVTGLVTGTKTRVLGTNTWLTVTTYYDDRCRVVQTVNDNLQGQKSRIDIKYDFVGNILRQRENHVISTSRTDILETVNTYDDRGRLLTSVTKLNNGTPATTINTYDAIGRLATRKQGNTTEAMTYNPRGWLTGKESTPFKMKLRYASPQSTTPARYNGNISEWEWQHGTNAPLMYGFTYDGVNRLKETSQFQKNGTTWTTLSGNYLERGITYDRNGNIKTLQRTANGTTVDNLIYTYTGNQLTGLNESIRTTPNGDIYAPGNAASGTYTHDKNGNMLNDSRKNLNFEYNVLNLLSTVKTKTTLAASYSYLADGTKLRVRDAGGNGFDYTGSLTYKKSNAGLQLESANFESGVIRANSSASGGFEINYFLTDHLGSVRVIVDASGTVKERNDYYPFGAKHARNDYAQQGGNRYKYNGQEEQVTGNTGFLDYGWRMYDSALARWWVPDPIAGENPESSPMAYTLNNPLKFIDYLGLDGIPVDDVDWPSFKPDEDVIELGEVTVTPTRRPSRFWASGPTMYFQQHHYGDYWIQQGLKIRWVESKHNTSVATLQSALDIIGLVPVAGEIFDGINALVYLCQGDYLNASLSATAMVPIAGWGATGGKVTNKAVKAFKASNFRKNMIRLTGINPGKGMQAHHVFPKKFRTRFDKLGINVNDPKFGSWWNTNAHQKNSYKYGQRWDYFFRNNPTPKKAYDVARELSIEYGFNLNF